MFTTNLAHNDFQMKDSFRDAVDWSQNEVGNASNAETET